jgi:membrane-bound lytic murein transglycosylase A
MNENPSYIFFREAEGLPAGSGPIGAAGVPLTPLRSVALDPEHHAPGGLFWLETTLPDGAPFRRLVVAQDTGAAIRGPGRVDLFFGSGPEAGRAAGRMRARGRLTPVRPRAGGAQ